MFTHQIWRWNFTTNSYTMQQKPASCVEVLAFLLWTFQIKIKLENLVESVENIAYLATSFFLFAVWSVAKSVCFELLKFFWTFGFRLFAFGLRIAPLITRLLFRRLLLGILPPFPRPIYNVSQHQLTRRYNGAVFMVQIMYSLWRLTSMVSCMSRHRFEIQVFSLCSLVAREVKRSIFQFFRSAKATKHYDRSECAGKVKFLINIHDIKLEKKRRRNICLSWKKFFFSKWSKQNHLLILMSCVCDTINENKTSNSVNLWEALLLMTNYRASSWQRLSIKSFAFSSDFS